MNGVERGDCEFDHGGYFFFIKGAEKTFITQEQICLKRLWVSSNPTWMVAYRPIWKRKKVNVTYSVFFINRGSHLDIVFLSLVHRQTRKLLIWLISTLMMLVFQIFLLHLFMKWMEAEKKGVYFCRWGNAISFVDKLVKSCKFPHGEGIQECFSKYLFPNFGKCHKCYWDGTCFCY